MKQAFILFMFFTFTSCIPLRIAPTIKEDKVMKAKKFKRSLPKEYALIFEDPKNANEFYNYIDAKFKNNYLDADWSLPFTMGNKEYFLSFYEVEISTKTINLIPIAINAHLDSKGYDPLLPNSEFTRKGHWYIALTVSNSKLQDCLHPNYNKRNILIEYLRELRLDYLNTQNYTEVFMRK